MSEIETEKKLSSAQVKAIEALLVCGHISQAATQAGVGRATLYRWLGEETFVNALRAAEAEQLQALSRRLAGLGEKAAQALDDALAPHQKPATRLRAAEIVIDRQLRLRELVELEARLAALEGKQNAVVN